VPSQCAFKLEWLRLRRLILWRREHFFKVLDFPDLRRVVGATGCKMLDVWGKENPSDVLAMSFEMGNWYQ